MAASVRGAGPRVALVTWDPGPDRGSHHARKARVEDAAIAAALAARGVDSARPVWSDPAIAWDEFDLIMIRTTWDYFDRLGEFEAWLARIDGAAPLWNPAAVVRWNADKRYLFDLAARGVALPPTARLPGGQPHDLAALVAARGWDEVVVKRAVGAGAAGQRRVARGDLADAQAHLDGLLAGGDVLVQPFLRSIERRGEVSAITIDGEVTHAVRKVPARGDYRSQPEYGAALVPHALEPAELELVRRALAAIGQEVLYGRVDMVALDDGRPALMELELIEPYLYVEGDPAAVDRVADGIRARLR